MVNKILISQGPPANMAPYNEICTRFMVSMDFQPFFGVEPLTSREFREQKVNITDCTAVVFSSRYAIDAYFHLCSELRLKVPDTMKYFCTMEAVAMYLQKYITYRKRRVYFGSGTAMSVADLIKKKHKGENVLVATSFRHKSDAITVLLDRIGVSYKAAAFLKPVSRDLKGLALSSYDLVVVCNPSDIVSLKENFPGLNPETLNFGAFGEQTGCATEEAGLKLVFRAPTPEAPSVAKAIELYLKEANK